MRTTMAALALAGSVAFCSPAAAQTTPVDTTPTIAADGIGFATLTPDIADFTASIRATARTSAKARDAVSDAAADQVEAPDFGFADPTQGRLLATRAALADARRRADDAAAVQGMRITGVRSTVLAPSSNEYDVQALSGGGDQSAGEKTAASTPTSIAPGTQEFAEQVRVVYTAAPLT